MLRPPVPVAVLLALLGTVSALRNENPYCDMDPKTLDPAKDL